jgi:hypothetical protein
MKQRLALIALCVALAFANSGCTALVYFGSMGSKKKGNKEDGVRVEKATVPERVGEVVLFNEDARFVLIDLATGNPPESGTALKVMRGHEEVGVVTVGDVRRRPFVVADVVKGEPQKGDVVFR